MVDALLRHGVTRVEAAAYVEAIMQAAANLLHRRLYPPSSRDDCSCFRLNRLPLSQTFKVLRPKRHGDPIWPHHEK